MFAPSHLEMFDFKTIIVVSPEASVQVETLVKAVENGKRIIIVAGVSDGLAAWAAEAKILAFAYPLLRLISPMGLRKSGAWKWWWQCTG